MPITALTHYETDNSDVIQGYRVSRVIVDEQTPVQHVVIYDTPAFGKVLVLDGSTQSAQHDEHIYHESLVHPAMTQHRDPKRVLILGGGEGATAREVLRYTSVDHVTMVDYDEQLMELCKKHLPEWGASAWTDPRLHVHATDAFEWLHARQESADGKFDVIIMDLCDPDILNPDDQINKFYTPEFFASLRNHHLNDGGVLVVQAGDYTLYKQVAYDIYKQFDSPGKGFHGGRICSQTYAVYIPSFSSMWTFVLSTKVRPGPGHIRSNSDEVHAMCSALPPGLKHMRGSACYALLASDFYTSQAYCA